MMTLTHGNDQMGIILIRWLLGAVTSITMHNAVASRNATIRCKMGADTIATMGAAQACMMAYCSAEGIHHRC